MARSRGKERERARNASVRVCDAARGAFSGASGMQVWLARSKPRGFRGEFSRALGIGGAFLTKSRLDFF